ncbi:MAG: MFS transporter [Luteolibacter sp.]
MTAAADLSGNPRRFVLFTVFYNARAYYPVLAILFLDLGLTLDQFVLLNLIWATTIFLFEVPSGALADTLGRRPLLIAAAVLMVMEMLCLLLAPRNGGTLLFSLCILNRILSGLSEACASGADEALAYDSLRESGREDAWDRTLSAVMRWRSVGFVIAMILGGLLYDPTAMNRILPDGFKLTPAIAHRLPVILVLMQGFTCLFITVKMVEPPRAGSDELGNTCKNAVRLTLQTARWVFTNPHTLVIVVIGLSIDSIARNLATINSSYYVLIGLKEWTFGFIGAAMGLLGWFVPPVAKKFNERFSTLTNLGIAAAVTFVGLAAVSQAWPIYGLLPAMLLMTTLGYLSFTISRALHRESDSSKRATVLSVKGLAFNLGYGLFSLGFSRLLAGFPDHPAGAALRHALLWQVPWFALMSVVIFTWAQWLWKRRSPTL